MRVLFISYYFKPFPGVGAKRLTYWHENAHKVGINSTLITAIEQTEKVENIVYVKPVEKRSIIGRLIKDPGVNWLGPLKAYFNSLNEFDYDCVVITGGPFMHFGIGKFLKKKFGVKITLDFRDPFAVNPGFKNNQVKVKFKQYFENKFIKSADLIISVNDYCLSLMNLKGQSSCVIDNGYDERIINNADVQISDSGKFVIAHAGTFISGNRNPTTFFQTIERFFDKEVSFVQYGADSEYFNDFREKEFFHYKGMVPYPELISNLSKTNACLIVTEGLAFESTTKVFDYIGLNKKVLIVTSGELNTGNLDKITKSYPNAIWCKNSVQGIKDGIIKIMQIELSEFDSSGFSRMSSLESLSTELKKLFK